MGIFTQSIVVLAWWLWRWCCYCCRKNGAIAALLSRPQRLVWAMECPACLACALAYVRWASRSSPKWIILLFRRAPHWPYSPHPPCRVLFGKNQMRCRVSTLVARYVVESYMGITWTLGVVVFVK